VPSSASTMTPARHGTAARHAQMTWRRRRLSGAARFCADTGDCKCAVVPRSAHAFAHTYIHGASYVVVLHCAAKSSADVRLHGSYHITASGSTPQCSSRLDAHGEWIEPERSLSVGCSLGKRTNWDSADRWTAPFPSLSFLPPQACCRSVH
jgi:hypothetical protein